MVTTTATHQSRYLQHLRQILSTTFPFIRLPSVYRIPHESEGHKATLQTSPHLGISSALGLSISNTRGTHGLRDDGSIDADPTTPHQLIVPYDVPAYPVAVSTRGLLLFPGVHLEWSTYRTLLDALRAAGVLSRPWYQEIIRNGHVAVCWPEIAAPDNLELPAMAPLAEEYLTAVETERDTADANLRSRDRTNARLEGQVLELQQRIEIALDQRNRNRTQIQELRAQINILEMEKIELQQQVKLTAATGW